MGYCIQLQVLCEQISNSKLSIKCGECGYFKTKEKFKKSETNQCKLGAKGMRLSVGLHDH